MHSLLIICSISAFISRDNHLLWIRSPSRMIQDHYFTTGSERNDLAFASLPRLASRQCCREPGQKHQQKIYKTKQRSLTLCLQHMGHSVSTPRGRREINPSQSGGRHRTRSKVIPKHRPHCVWTPRCEILYICREGGGLMQTLLPPIEV